MKKMRLNNFTKKFLWSLVMIPVTFTADAQWKKKADFPTSAGNGRRNAYVFSANNKVYIGGGYVAMYANTDEMVEYDPATDKWKSKNPLPGGFANRSAGITFKINGKVYLGLGAENYNAFNPGPVFLKDLWEYDPAGDKWTKKADLPDTGRADAGVFVLNNKAYVVGGYTGSFSTDIFYSADLWEYDPTANKWTSKKAFPEGAINNCMAFAVNGKGYLTGGSIEGAGGLSKKTYQYDPAADTWTPKADFPETRSAGVSFVINNKAYVGLGIGGSGLSATFYIYDAAKDSWHYMSGGGDFPTPGGRFYAVAEVMGNKVYVGGGAIGNNVLRDWYELDPASLLSIGENTADRKLRCYPNPAINELFFDMGKQLNDCNFAIYSITGQKVLNGLLSGSNRIDISSLPSGQYIIELVTGEQTAKQVFSVNR